MWEEATLEAFLGELDAYVWQQQSWAKTHRSIDADAGPDYQRLAYPQRLAMAQELFAALEPSVKPEPEEPIP
mgnify:FL=1